MFVFAASCVEQEIGEGATDGQARRGKPMCTQRRRRKEYRGSKRRRRRRLLS